MPFRRAKLTACRKVRGMYRRHRVKSSAYGHKSAMAQAHLRHRRARNHPGSMPLARMMRTAAGEARNATKARTAAWFAAPAASPAE
jgi:hypothetical protein